MSGFAAHEVFGDAHERIEGDHERRWIPLLAAGIAVLAAIFSLLAAQRSTAINYVKNEAILAQTHAGNEFSRYESHIIQAEIAQLAGDVGREPATVRSRVVHEHAAGEASQQRAQSFERVSTRFDERAEHLKASYEIMEAGVTVLEISIVFVSLSTLVPSRALTLASISAIAIGIAAACWGLIAGYF